MSVLETIPSQFGPFKLEECYDIGPDGNTYILDQGERVTLDQIPKYISEEEVVTAGLDTTIHMGAACHGSREHLDETLDDLRQAQVQETPDGPKQPLLDAAKIFGVEFNWRPKDPNKPSTPNNSELIYEERYANRRAFQESQVETYCGLGKILIPFDCGEHELTAAHKRVLAANYICRNIYDDESLSVEERAHVATIASIIYPFARQPLMISSFIRGLNALKGHLDSRKTNHVVFHSGYLHKTIANFKWLESINIEVHETQHADYKGRLKGLLKNSNDMAEIINQGYATNGQIENLKQYHISNI